MKRLELMVANGKLAGRRFAVGDGGLRLGRSSSNDIAVRDEQLSRNHCLFEPVGATDIQVTDLASANGTFVNGTAAGTAPVLLHLGDLVTVGSTVLSVVGDQPLPKEGEPVGGGTEAGQGVDLGLGEPSADAPAPSSEVRRSPLMKVLWLAVVVLAGAAIYLILTTQATLVPAPVAALAEESKPVVVEVRYEKVEATLEGIFRYELTFARDGMLRVTLDDTKENRHPRIEPKALSAAATNELNAVLSLDALREIDREYVGPDPEEGVLDSRVLQVVYTTAARRIRVVNAELPEAFRAVCEKLEAFSNNELGIHAIQYSREKLVSLAEESIAVGKAKWEDRDVQHGNLFGSAKAYQEAIYYLETVDPKPPCIREAREGLATAKAELERRYGDQRFAVDRAIRLSDWDAARRELSVLLEMIPDRRDDRNREATAKLIDVEKRMKGNK